MMTLNLLRKLGCRLQGFRGVDRLLRICHHPDKRQEIWIASCCKAKWNGPKYFLETRYFLEWTVFFYGTFDNRIHDFLRTNADEKWVSFDIGANIGFFSILLAHLSPKGVVHSFEPVPALNARLRRNAEINSLTNIVSSELAVSNSIGSADLFIPAETEANPGTGSIKPDEALRSRHTITVRTTTVDGYVKEHGVERVDFMKIDVEGAEDLVIEGGMATINRFRPILIIERNESSFTKVDRMLRSCGYSGGTLPKLHRSVLFNEPDYDFLFRPNKASNESKG